MTMAQRIDPKDIGDLPTKPYQPRHISFPPRTFGKQSPVQRMFQNSWFHKWQWLNYNVAQDAVHCFMCCKALKDGGAKITGLAEDSFLVNGFTNWKDATTKFAKHESSDFHKVCAEALSSTVDNPCRSCLVEHVCVCYPNYCRGLTISVCEFEVFTAFIISLKECTFPLMAAI